MELGGEIVKYHARHRQIDRGREREMIALCCFSGVTKSF